MDGRCEREEQARREILKAFRYGVLQGYELIMHNKGEEEVQEGIVVLQKGGFVRVFRSIVEYLYKDQ